MVLFYSEIKSLRDNQDSDINENVSFLPSRIYMKELEAKYRLIQIIITTK